MFRGVFDDCAHRSQELMRQDVIDVPKVIGVGLYGASLLTLTVTDTGRTNLLSGLATGLDESLIVCVKRCRL